ncbi:MAG: hypothetical protein RIQ41_409 [Candidatus Parcubacteria bacterium]
MRKSPSDLSDEDVGLLALVTWWDDIDGHRVTCYGTGIYAGRKTFDDGPVLIFTDVNVVAVRDDQEDGYVMKREQVAIRPGRVHNNIHLDEPKQALKIGRVLLRRLRYATPTEREVNELLFDELYGGSEEDDT